MAERKRSEAERLELERRLLHAQKLESLGVLAGGIAHDFNNLLQAVLGNLDLALATASPGAPAPEGLEAAALAARKAADLTRQLLAYSGRGHFDVRAVELGQLVRDNAALLRTSVSRNVALELSLASDLPAIEADAGQLQQVVMNLLTNASEAIGSKPGTIRLSTKVREPTSDELGRTRTGRAPEAGRFVELAVADDGCGMDAATLERLFDPFFTTKKTGRGLGMSALQGIVRGHRGALLVDSTEGRGTVVRVLFPVKDGVRPPAPEPAPAKAKATAAASAPRGAVLVVDDEELVRTVGRAMLRSLKRDVLTAASGKEALELYRAHAGHIETVLLDLSMPEMDGIATLKALRVLDPAVRVLLSSGYDEEDSVRSLPPDPNVVFLQKPYTLATLREALGSR
ncbi:MAG: response regulator [Myxococcales bacterium]